jgi:cysteine desulfurase/selenocysteine lyase
MPVMDRFGVPATTRAAFAFYNTHEEVDRLADNVLEASRMLGSGRGVGRPVARKKS